MKIKIRSQYVPAPGKIFVAFDLAQAESWVTAHLAKEMNMIHSLSFGDVHTDTALFLFDQANFKCFEFQAHKWKSEGKNKVCKTCGITVIETKRYIGKQNNHANSYGQGPDRMTQTINKQSDKPPYVTVTTKECRVYQKDWHTLYPNIKVWHEATQQELWKTRTLITPYGFKRKFYSQLPKVGENSNVWKEAYAFIPQSSVLDHFVGTTQPDFVRAGGLSEIRKKLVRRGEIDIVNMSHDSAIIECPEHMADDIASSCKELMTRPMLVNDMEFTIPVDVEIGYNYGELTGWKKAA
jgi:DNA polymerase I-like protein with 3'-5' exonuclease and polymerase domains